jgi:hypothetical protein
MRFYNNRWRYQMRFTLTIATLAVLIALIISPVYAAPLPQDNSIRAAFELLLKTDIVRDSAVGPAGALPAEYEAFETLWKAGKAAEPYALKLISDGTPAARVYGAILLLEFDRAAAEREFPRLEKETIKVGVQSGCFTIPSPVGELVRRLNQGESVIGTPRLPGVRRK